MFLIHERVASSDVAIGNHPFSLTPCGYPVCDIAVLATDKKDIRTATSGEQGPYGLQNNHMALVFKLIQIIDLQTNRIESFRLKLAIFD